jgi:predicted neuraminidase
LIELKPALASKTAVAALLCLVVAIAAEAMRHASRPARPNAMLAIEPAPASAAAPAAARLPQLEWLSTSMIPMPEGVPSAHASTLVALGGGELLALWWAGSRESAPDVAVYASAWQDERWTPARRIVERHELSAQLGFGVRRLGNPVAWVARDGRLHLYVVATGPGGWAAARVAHLISIDRGKTFKAKRVLPLSPLFNTSVLVRSHPVALDDGGWLLPAYFEMGHKMPMLIAMDAMGVPQWSRRIGASTASLQPALLPVSPTQLRAVMRDQSPQHRIRQALSQDAGLSWSDATALEAVNEDTAVAALRLAQGGYVMVHNDRAAEGTPRHWLRLSTSADAGVWQAALDVQRGAPGEEYSYPSLLQIGDRLHLSYTFQRKAIAHRVYRIGAAPAAP